MSKISILIASKIWIISKVFPILNQSFNLKVEDIKKQRYEKKKKNSLVFHELRTVYSTIPGSKLRETC